MVPESTRNAARKHFESIQNLKALVDELPSSEELYTGTLETLGQSSRDWIASPQVAGYAQSYDDALVSYIDEYDWRRDLNTMLEIIENEALIEDIAAWVNTNEILNISESLLVCQNHLTQFHNNIIEMGREEGRVDLNRFEEFYATVEDDIARARGYASVAKESFIDLRRELKTHITG